MNGFLNLRKVIMAALAMTVSLSAVSQTGGGYTISCL